MIPALPFAPDPGMPRMEHARLAMHIASPENWSFGEWSTAGGIAAAIVTWCWKKPLKKLINMWSAPDRIELILKNQLSMMHGIRLATALSQVTWAAIPRPVWQSDANGMTVHVNPFMLRLLCRQEDEILGGGWVNTIHEEDRERVEREWKAAVEGKRDFHLHYRWVNASGDPIPVVAQASRLMSEDGQILGFVGFATLINP